MTQSYRNSDTGLMTDTSELIDGNTSNDAITNQLVCHDSKVKNYESNR